jgi:hypothetical protein
VTRVWTGAGLALVVAAVVWTGYDGRDTQREASVDGCERAKVNRRADVRDLRAEVRATRLVATDPAQPSRTRAARRDELAAKRLSLRTKRRLLLTNCQAAYPDARVLPRPLP